MCKADGCKSASIDYDGYCRKHYKTKNKQFEPELGQMVFGNKWTDYDAPDFVIAGLMLLEHEIERVEWNIRQKSFESPISSGGWGSSDESEKSYVNKVFEIHPYYWGEKKKLKERPNFKCGPFEVRWYKHMGRGMSMNLPLDANEFFFLIDKCMKYLADKDKKHAEEWDKWAEKEEKENE